MKRCTTLSLFASHFILYASRCTLLDLEPVIAFLSTSAVSSHLVASLDIVFNAFMLIDRLFFVVVIGMSEKALTIIQAMGGCVYVYIDGV